MPKRVLLLLSIGGTLLCSACKKKDRSSVSDLFSIQGVQVDKAFSGTFIYGSYNGALTFYEPMGTLTYFQSTPATIHFEESSGGHLVSFDNTKLQQIKKSR